MSLRGLLRHWVAIVTPGVPDMTNLGDDGVPVVGDPSVRCVKGLIQPRDAHEIVQPLNEGVLTSDYLIFLEVIPLSAAAYITYADEDTNLPIDGAPRYQINGIQPFLYGRDPHLEVLATQIGGSEVLYIPGS